MLLSNDIMSHGDECMGCSTCIVPMHGFAKIKNGHVSLSDVAIAGSCIDGRLTSLWNWASMIEKKPYYNVFKLAGFTGFDGDFQK